MQDLKVQLVRPPVPVCSAAAGRSWVGPSCDRAFTAIAHIRSPFGFGFTHLALFKKNIVSGYSRLGSPQHIKI
jgi:hypothetical protein